MDIDGGNNSLHPTATRCAVRGKQRGRESYFVTVPSENLRDLPVFLTRDSNSHSNNSACPCFRSLRMRMCSDSLWNNVVR
jgi:hypothetical protein